MTAVDYELRHPFLSIEGSRFYVANSFVATVPRAALEGSPHAATIEAKFSVESQDWIVTSFAALAESGGRPVTTESLREMGVAFTLRQALQSMRGVIVDDADHDWASMYDRETELLKLRKTDGPTPENLSDVAAIYRITKLLRNPTTLGVALAFEIPERTASHWIKLAREREHLWDQES